MSQRAPLGFPAGVDTLPGTGRMLVANARGVALIGRRGARHCPVRRVAVINSLDIKTAASRNGAVVVSWVHRPPHTDRVSVVAARPGGCFGPVRTFRLQGADAALLHLAVGDGGTLAVVWRRRDNHVTYSAGPIGGRLRRGGDLGPIRDAVPTMIAGDRIVFSYVTTRPTADPFRPRERVWTVRTAARGGRLGHRQLLIRRRRDPDVVPGVTTADVPIGDVFVLTARDGDQLLAWPAQPHGALRLAARRWGGRLGHVRTIPGVVFGESVAGSIGPRGDAVLSWIDDGVLYGLVRRRDGHVSYRRLTELLPEDPTAFSSLAVADSGRVAIAWIASTSPHTEAATVEAAVSGAGGRLGPPEHIASRGVVWGTIPSIAATSSGRFAASWGAVRPDGTAVAQRSYRRQ